MTTIMTRDDYCGRCTAPVVVEILEDVLNRGEDLEPAVSHGWSYRCGECGHTDGEAPQF